MPERDKFAEIRVKFARISYTFHRNCCIHTLAGHIRSCEICTKFVRIFHEFHVNLTKCSHLMHLDGAIVRYHPPHFHTVYSTPNGPW